MNKQCLRATKTILMPRLFRPANYAALAGSGVAIVRERVERNIRRQRTWPISEINALLECFSLKDGLKLVSKS